MTKRSLLEYTIASFIGGGLSWGSNRRLIPEAIDYFQTNITENQEQNLIALSILLGSAAGMTLLHYWNKIPIQYIEFAGAFGAGFKTGMLTYGISGDVRYAIGTAMVTGVAAYKGIGALDTYIKHKRKQKENTQHL